MAKTSLSIRSPWSAPCLLTPVIKITCLASMLGGTVFIVLYVKCELKGTDQHAHPRSLISDFVVRHRRKV